MLTRKRRRAGSSPAVVVSSLRRRAKAKSRAAPPLPESVELLIRFTGEGPILKTYVVKIDSADLKAFSEVDVLCDYFHDHCKPPEADSSSGSGRFCDLKTPPRLVSALQGGGDIPKCYAALLGSKLYSVFYLPLPGEVFEFKSMDLLENPDISEDEKWSPLPPPPCELEPCWKPTCFPKLFSLRGRLYFLGALNPTALVFDPVTLTWSTLPGPPELGHQLYPSFEASLGEKHGKLLFYNTPPGQRDLPVRVNDSICIYDVVTDTWAVHPDTPLRGNSVRDQNIVGNPVPAVNSQEPCTIYWLHKHLGEVFAFDWLNMRLSRGPISGFGDDYVRTIIKHRDISFCHVWAQIFCLFWSETISDSTHFHLTFLRVVDNDVGLVTALVVGCHKFTLPGSFSAYEASLLR